MSSGLDETRCDPAAPAITARRGRLLFALLIAELQQEEKRRQERQAD